MVGQHRTGAAVATAFALLAPLLCLALPAQALDAEAAGAGDALVVAPGGSFSIRFALVNANDTYMDARISVEGLTPSFQPRVYVNGSESDSASVPPGETFQCAASVQAPWLAMEGIFEGSVEVSTEEASWSIPFNVSVEVPSLTVVLDGGVSVSDGLASIEGTLRNPTRTDAVDVLLTLTLDGRSAVQQKYGVVAGGTNVSFRFEWPADEGETDVTVVAASRNGIGDEAESSYSVTAGSPIDSDLIILVGGILALVFPLVVLAQMGVQRRREKKALERRERERQLGSALLTLKEGER